jgi:NADH-quinone oxidoreductase subunit N
VLVLGMVILMTEAFAGKIDKRVLAFTAITGLAIVLLASFFVVPAPSPAYATGFWSFYAADRLAIFFKQFALLTTIFVVIMMIDYAPVCAAPFPGAACRQDLGEFVALPLFTCAGLMYLVSAIDFVFIFVALELGNRVVLCAGQFYPAQSYDARSGNEVSGAQRASRQAFSCTGLHGFSARPARQISIG